VGFAPTVRISNPSVLLLSSHQMKITASTAITNPQCTRYCGSERSAGKRADWRILGVWALAISGLGSFIGPLTRKLVI